MTDDTIRAVLDRYDARLDKLVSSMATDWQDKELAHLLTMIPKMRDMHAKAMRHFNELGDGSDMGGISHAKKREKLMRWLGFLQGALYAKGIYTIDEMRAHNKPEGEVFRDRHTLPEITPGDWAIIHNALLDAHAAVQNAASIWVGRSREQRYRQEAAQMQVLLDKLAQAREVFRDRTE